jgi:hypothetical protein
LDYRSKKGLAAGINPYYSIKGLGKGSAKVYYALEDKRLTFEDNGQDRTRYRWQARHKWDVGKGTDTTGVLEFNKFSDKDMLKDYFYKEYEEFQDPNDYNYISLVTAKPDYTLQFLLRKRFDKFYSVVERLPEFNIDIKNHRMSKKFPVYYKGNASAVYLNETFANTDPSQKDLNTTRVDTYNQVSYAAKILKFWYCTPYIGTEQTYYSRNRWGDTNLVRGVLKAGIDNSTKFYKVYNVDSCFLGMEIHKLRHIITPTAAYYYTHQPTISPDNLNQFDVIDSVDTANGIILSLENKLQTKRLAGKDWQSVDIARFIVSTDFAFRLKKDIFNIKNDKFKTVDFKLDLIPYPWLYSLSTWSVNTKKYNVQTANVDIVGNGGDKWAVGMGLDYENSDNVDQSNLTLGAFYKINEKWKARIYERYSFEKAAFQESEFTIYRDLHCWLGEVTYNWRNGGGQSLWFALRLKAFPDYPIGLKRTYYRPQFGSVGN